jgi:anaerobic magnesium-protoporphyrin IX monomethyl ester cyclase
MDQEICKGLATAAPGTSGFRAAVIVPPVCDFYFTPHRFSCLGAQVVCKILLECEIPFDFFNFPLMKKNPHVVDAPYDMNYLKEYIDPRECGKLSYFTKYQRFGPSSSECARIVVDSFPSICLISCFAYSYAKEAVDLARDIKKLRPDLPVAIGGAGVSAYPLYFMRDKSVDYAIVGEAEISLGPFLDALRRNGLHMSRVPNLFSSMQTVRFTSDHEIMPVTAKVHEKKDSAYYSVSLTRGCNNRCRFCSNFLGHGHGFRAVAFDSVASMINRLSIDRKSNLIVNFEDDNLLYATDYLLKVMGLFRGRFEKVSFLAENGIDYNMLTPSIADGLIDAGMSKFNFTFGSSGESVLRYQDRQGSTTHFKSIVRHVASRGIPVLSYFICGLKGDTKESVADTLTFLFSLPTQVGISMFYAIPGLPDFADTTLFDSFAPCMSNGSSAYPWYGNDGLQTLTLITAFRLSRYINLVKSSLQSKIELQLIEKVKNEKMLYTLVKNMGKVEIVPAPGVDEELIRIFFLKIEGRDLSPSSQPSPTSP